MQCTIILIHANKKKNVEIINLTDIDMIQIEKLSYAYHKSKKAVLHDFSLSLDGGKIYGLLGKNGAGKSTLLYLISGLLTPQKGRVLMKGNDVRKRLPETLADVFIVPEEFELPKVMLSEYVKMYASFYPKFNEDDMVHSLEVFGIEEDVDLGTLSMGQKKKVFMSFALATNTSLLVMDEPTNGLDIPGKSQFRKFMAACMSDERVVVISTHQVKDIDKIIDHVLILDDSNVLMNAGVGEINEKLLFVESNNPKLAQNALYAQTSLLGYSAILENTDGEDSEINLETLFNATLLHPDKITALFNNRK